MNQTATELFGDDVSVEESRYFDLVDEACRNSEPKTISNSVPKHAVYLIHTLLTNAKNRIRLLTGSLSCDEGGVRVYANKKLAEAACDFLSRPETTLQIALRDGVDGGGDPKEHPFVKTILSQADRRGQLELRKCNQATVEKLKDDGFDMHWMTMDENAYRLEYDTVNFKAYADFGDPETAKVLNELFDDRFFGPGEDLLASTA